MNNWNRLLAISRHHKNPKKKKHAELLLDGMNTAGGPDILRDEITIFLKHTYVPKQSKT